MRARRVVVGASFQPETIKVMTDAFDAAWEEISGGFSDDDTLREKARILLAQAVINVTSEESRNVEAVKRGALEAMLGEYQRGLGRSAA